MLSNDILSWDCIGDIYGLLLAYHTVVWGTTLGFQWMSSWLILDYSCVRLDKMLTWLQLYFGDFRVRNGCGEHSGGPKFCFLKERNTIVCWWCSDLHLSLQSATAITDYNATSWWQLCNGEKARCDFEIVRLGLISCVTQPHRECWQVCVYEPSCQWHIF